MITFIKGSRSDIDESSCISEVKVNDDTPFEVYRKQVMDIMNNEIKTTLVWNLLSLTHIPYDYFFPQINLMHELRNIIWKRIDKSYILVSNEKFVQFLRMLFYVYTPQRPVTVITI